MSALELLSEPRYEPVSLAEAREWLRLETDDTANTLTLRLLIRAMRETAENLTQRAFISRQYRLNRCGWPTDPEYGYRISLPFPPLRSVDSIKYLDSSGDEQTLSSSLYVVHDEAEPAFIIPAYQQVWPVVRYAPDSVRVTFTAGYAEGSPPDEQSAQLALPSTLRLWMQARIATLFENREQLIVGTIVASIPRDFADALLDPLVIGTRIF